MSCSFFKNNSRHILLVKSNSQGTENTKLPSVLSTFWQSYDTKLFQFRLLHLGKFIFTKHTERAEGKTIPSVAQYHYPTILRRKSINMVNIKQLTKKNIFLKKTSQWLLLKRKQLCWSPFLILSIAKFLRPRILKNICERLLLKICSRN